MNKLESWLQVIIPTVASLVFGGVGLYLISQFKERLPVWFYNALIFVIYVVFVAILLFFLILIIRAAFGAWLQRQIRDFRQQRYRRKLATTLFNKWLELSALIKKIIENNRQPTQVQSDKYLELHVWFIANRPQFLSDWITYDYRRTDSAHDSEYWDSDRDLGYKVFREYHRDPFSYFYEPPNAYVLMHYLRNESTEEIRMVLGKLTELTLEFVRWIRI